jgi:hypothetical protein
MDPLAIGWSVPSRTDLPTDGTLTASHADGGGNLATIPRNDHRTHGAAGTAVSSAMGLSRWMSMLLDIGARDGRQLVAPETLWGMFAPTAVAETAFTEVPSIDERTGFSYSSGWCNFHYGRGMDTAPVRSRPIHRKLEQR